ncbi:MAG TPA: DUF2752 domain-containing protein [Pedobacter sp.]|uniref:DUF2752 domain-containing protein n=1 Tax=Pedobacter sp. TaxID=1411316 RepID=UPI002CD079C3|nr:DUF2752 domain-containing protein [Pedobacter sp.]HMI03162.1 DUF2752 domain-containing protein [Pedobacter sp.]
MLTSKIYILSVWSSFSDQADNFLLPCPFKYLTGTDCPGCGFQRSVIALAHGDLKESLNFYPPAIPLLVTLAIVLIAKLRRGDLSDSVIRILYLITGSAVAINYLFKIITHYLPVWLHGFHLQ